MEISCSVWGFLNPKRGFRFLVSNIYIFFLEQRNKIKIMVRKSEDKFLKNRFLLLPNKIQG